MIYKNVVDIYIYIYFLSGTEGEGNWLAFLLNRTIFESYLVVPNTYKRDFFFVNYN